jgi:hypothetical protein
MIFGNDSQHNFIPKGLRNKAQGWVAQTQAYPGKSQMKNFSYPEGIA